MELDLAKHVLRVSRNLSNWFFRCRWKWFDLNCHEMKNFLKLRGYCLFRLLCSKELKVLYENIIEINYRWILNYIGFLFVSLFSLLLFIVLKMRNKKYQSFKLENKTMFS